MHWLTTKQFRPFNPYHNHKHVMYTSEPYTAWPFSLTIQRSTLMYITTRIQSILNNCNDPFLLRASKATSLIRPCRTCQTTLWVLLTGLFYLVNLVNRTKASGMGTSYQCECFVFTAGNDGRTWGPNMCPRPKVPPHHQPEGRKEPGNQRQTLWYVKRSYLTANHSRKCIA